MPVYCAARGMKSCPGGNTPGVDYVTGGYRPDRSGRHGPEPRTEYERPRLQRRGAQPIDREGRRLHRRPGGRPLHHRASHHRVLRRRAAAAPARDADGARGRRRRPDHCNACAPPRTRRHRHRRRQLPLPRFQPALRNPARARHTLRRRRRLGRRGGRALRPVDHAGGRRGGLARGATGVPGDRRAGGRRALLRLDRPCGLWALREDGAQRYRVRRHATHRRGLRPAAPRPGAGPGRPAPGVQSVERRCTGFLPDRDHGRYHARERRGRRPAAAAHPRRRRPERHG